MNVIERGSGSAGPSESSRGWKGAEPPARREAALPPGAERLAASERSEPTAIDRDRIRFPRPIALLIVGAIAVATLLALFWPALPWSEGRRIVLGPTKVGVITRQIEDAAAAGKVGALAPDFEWVAPSGARVSLSSLRPRAVVVNFWATWCEPCKNEMPLIDRTAAETTTVTFLAVDLDEDGDRIRRFLDQLGVTRVEPLLDVDLVTTKRYGVLSLPTTFFVDAGGTIRHMKVGEMSADDLRRGLEAIR